MKLRIEVAPAASHDTAQIWSRIAEDSVRAADRFLDRLEAGIELTASMPSRGERDQRVGGCRRFLLGPYLVFYEATDDTLHVLRVYHGARRIEDLTIPETNR